MQSSLAWAHAGYGPAKPVNSGALHRGHAHTDHDLAILIDPGLQQLHLSLFHEDDSMPH